MAYKTRIEKDELKILRFLNTRMELPEKEKKKYWQLEKGFEGEVKFDKLTENLPGERYLLNDLLLEANNTKFQIDTTMIVQEKIHLFEVKNFEGDYVYDAGKFFTLNGKEISDPLDQIKRSESLFNQLLQSLGFRVPVESHVIFINPEFNLYQTPRNLPFVFPTQLNRFMKSIELKPSKLNGKHKKLADQLVTLHQIESPYDRLFHYEYEQPQKGMTCALCHSFLVTLQGKELVCTLCGAHEHIDAAIVRSVEEIKLLFPDRKITTPGIDEWCMGIVSRKVIQRILDNNYKIIGYNRWAYYQ